MAAVDRVPAETEGKVIMALNPMGSVSYNWNCTKPDKDDYSLEITGTVIFYQEVQARHYNPGGGIGQPKFWPNGDPQFNLRVGLATQTGELKTITMAEAGKGWVEKKKPSLHIQLWELAGRNMEALIGKTVHIWTWPTHPKTGQVWGQGNPRLFGVEEIAGVKYELAQPLPDEFKVPQVLCNDAASGGQPVPPAPQQMQQPQVPQYQQPIPQYQQPVYQQPVYQTPIQPVQQYAPMPTQAQITMSQPQYGPAGMDPAVAQAMSVAEQVPTDVYGDVISF